MQDRGETVIGSPSRSKPLWIVAGVVIVLLLAIAVVLIQQYARPTPPTAAKEHRSVEERMNLTRPTTPNPMIEPDPRKGSAKQRVVAP